MTRDEVIELMTASFWTDGKWSAEAATMYDALVRAGLLVSAEPVNLQHECCEEVPVLRASLARAWSAWLSLLVDLPDLVEDLRVSSPDLMHKLHQYLSGQIEPVRRPTPACETYSAGSTPS